MMMRFLALFLPLAFTLMARAETPPIQQWINEAIQAGGGVVTVPEGVHVLSEPLVITKAKKLALRGVGKERCVLKLASAGPGALIEITGDSEAVEIASLTLDGSSEASPKGTKLPSPPAALLRITGPDKTTQTPPVRDITVRDCLLQNFAGSGITFKNAEACVVERCSFRDGGGHAIGFADHTQKGVARGNQITRVHTAFLLAHAEACILEGNEVRGCTLGVDIQADERKAAKHTLKNNAFGGGQLLITPKGTPPPLFENNDDLILAK